MLLRSDGIPLYCTFNFYGYGFVFTDVALGDAFQTVYVVCWLSYIYNR